MTDPHARALSLAEQGYAAGDQTGWLDRFYAEAGDDPARIPWARDEPNENLVPWLDARAAHSGRALVVGCGLGVDAEELARRGWDVTAFDVAPSAVAWARRRHPDSAVTYVAANLLDPPAEWLGAWDLVVDIYTVQVLRDTPRATALATLPALVAPGGTLLVIARGRDADEDEGDLPWPLTKAELDAVALPQERFEDYVDGEGRRRFRVEWRRP
jgi:SAM-dependent methyltransferase